MSNEIQILSDGDGVALLGDSTAIDHFLRSEGIASKHLDLPRLRSVAQAGGTAAQIGSEVATTSGRWVKLTKQSADALAKSPMMKGSSSDTIRAIAMDGNKKTKHILEIVRTPGSILTNPAMLAGAAGLMSQLAMQQQMDEITDYLAAIDEKVDDILRGQKDAALSAMIGAELVIDDALTVREQMGGVSEVTWSKVQAAPMTIAQTQAYAVRRLDALAEKLEKKASMGDLAKACNDTQGVVGEWLAVLARCFQLQDAVAILELDRVLGAEPDEVDRHRQALQVARQRRIEPIARSTERLLARMDAAAGTANVKVLLHPIASQAVVQSTTRVTTSVIEFHQLLGIERDRDAVEVRRWLEAAVDVRDKAVEVGSQGVGAVKQRGSATLIRGRSASMKLSSGIADRTLHRRTNDTASDDEED